MELLDQVAERLLQRGEALERASEPRIVDKALVDAAGGVTRGGGPLQLCVDGVESQIRRLQIRRDAFGTVQLR